MTLCLALDKGHGVLCTMQANCDHPFQRSSHFAYYSALAKGGCCDHTLPTIGHQTSFRNHKQNFPPAQRRPKWRYKWG